MYTIYANLVKRYDYPQFQNFYDLVNHFCDALHMMHYGWNHKSMLNMHVTFKLSTIGCTCCVTHLLTTRDVSMVNKDDWTLVTQFVKD
jgi:hypothetical protein